MARKSCIIGEYIIEQLDSGAISVYRVFENAIGGILEAAKVAGFKLDDEWNTRQAGSKLIDFVNESKGGAEQASGPVFTIDAQLTCGELKEQFNKEFGGVLRVKSSNRIVQDDVVLSTIDVKSADIEYNDNFTVEEFINAVQEETGLTIKVRTPDNWVSVIPEMPLYLVGNISNGTTIDKMKKFLEENQ